VVVFLIADELFAILVAAASMSWAFWRVNDALILAVNVSTFPSLQLPDSFTGLPEKI